MYTYTTQNLGVPTLSRKDIGKLIERLLVDPLSPAVAASAPSSLDYVAVLRIRLNQIMSSSSAAAAAPPATAGGGGGGAPMVANGRRR